MSLIHIQYQYHEALHVATLVGLLGSRRILQAERLTCKAQEPTEVRHAHLPLMCLMQSHPRPRLPTSKNEASCCPSCYSVDEEILITPMNETGWSHLSLFPLPSTANGRVFEGQMSESGDGIDDEGRVTEEDESIGSHPVPSVTPVTKDRPNEKTAFMMLRFPIGHLHSNPSNS